MKALHTLICILFLFATASTAVAQNIFWKGDNGSDWHDPTNWDPPILPAPGTTAYIQPGQPIQPVISTGVTCGNLDLWGGATLDVVSGSLHVMGDFNVDGTLTVQPGVAPLRCSGDLKLAGAMVHPGPIYLDGFGTTYSTNKILPPITVDGGTRWFEKTATPELLVTGGELAFASGGFVSVSGNVQLLAGTVRWAADGGYLEGLDVEGDLTVTGATVVQTGSDSRISCAGNWSSPSTFVMPSGIVELDGGTSQTIGGPSPTFGNLDLVDTGTTRTLVSDVSVLGTLRVRTNTTLDLADRTLTASGNFESHDGGVTVVGSPGLVVFDGTTTLKTGTKLLPPVRVDGGSVTADTSLLTSLEMTAGNFDIVNGKTVSVTGNVLLTGGTLNWLDFDTYFETLDVEGNFTVTGAVVGTTNSGARLFCAGNWSSPASFLLPTGVVELDGGTAATVGGPSPTFTNLEFVDAGSVKTLVSDVSVLGTLRVRTNTTLDLADRTLTASGNFESHDGGVTVVGSPGLVVFDGTTTLKTGTKLLPPVRVDGASVTIDKSLLTSLEMTAGSINLVNGKTVSVVGDVLLTGGTLNWLDSDVYFETLDVEGDFTADGVVAGTTNSGTRLCCAGDWSSDSRFAMAQGIVELDGAGTSSVSGVGPGFDPSFPALVVRNGTRVAGNDLTLVATSIDVASTGALELGGTLVSVPAGPLDVDGELAVGAGGELRLGAGVAVNVAGSGTLRVVGDPGDPASVTGYLGGGYALAVGGTLAAQHYRFEELGPAGLVLTGALAAAPDDLRSGLFDRAAPGGVLLDLRQSAGATLWYVSFLDSNGTAAANVRRTSGPPVAFANWTGAFGGEAFENDTNDLVDWLAYAATELSSFTAKSGPEQVTLGWVTTQEVDVQAFVLESAPAAVGPYSTVSELAPLGPGSYAFVHAPLAEGQAVHYRLSERVSSGTLNLLAAASALPYDADLPAAFRTVGPGGTYATIQAAVDSISGPLGVVQVEGGTYPSFSIDAPGADVHVIADGSGPVVIDTTSGPLEVANTPFGRTVWLEGLEVLGHPGGPSVLVLNTVGPVIFDSVVIHGGANEAALRAENALVVALQRCELDGAPGLAALASTVYAGRGALDDADLALGSILKTAQVAPSVTFDGTSSHVAFAGIQPDLEAPAFPTLGQSFDFELETQPGGLWLLLFSVGYGYLDLGDPALWQMATFINPLAYVQVTAGITDGVTGEALLPLQLPPDGVLFGVELVFQMLEVSPSAPLIRPSNARTLFPVP